MTIKAWQFGKQSNNTCLEGRGGLRVFGGTSNICQQFPLLLNAQQNKTLKHKMSDHDLGDIIHMIV